MEGKYGWRKVSEELPLTSHLVLVKYQTNEIAIARYKDSKFHTTIANATFGKKAVEWKPILL